MTTKLRYDNPERHHDQISAIRRISNMWNKLAPADMAHYSTMAREAHAEYVWWTINGIPSHGIMESLHYIWTINDQ